MRVTPVFSNADQAVNANIEPNVTDFSVLMNGQYSSTLSDLKSRTL